MSNFLAHPENVSGEPHLLHDHLRCVGTLTKQFAEAGNAQLATVAEWAGLLHDLGKYRAEFQEYLRGQRHSSHETHHAVYGAALAKAHNKWAMAFVIAAHHAGLHDLDELQELIKSPKYNTQNCLPELVAKFEIIINNELKDRQSRFSGSPNAVIIHHDFDIATVDQTHEFARCFG